MKKTFTKQFEWVMGMTGSTSCFSPTRRLLLLLCLILVGVGGAKAQSYQTFDADKCYTKVLIDAKINDFAGNTKPMGFGSYNSETDVITQPQWKTDISNGSNRDLVMDYVAGLVAKACIEAADYYKDFTWSKPWFKLVENYATKVTVPTTGASLDDLNASKMYFALAELTKSGAKYENSTTYNKAITELKKALTGLKAVNDNYSIRSGSTVNYYSSGKKTFNLVDAKGNELSPATSGMNAIGGWYHKATYPNEMWCDSEYMGPALLAQLVAYAANNTSAGIGTITGSTEGDWKLIAKQFDITWNYLWNSTDKLLYHGFSATPTAVGAHTYTWATGKNGTNKDYWGRAIGWYFLALVDVLENMPDNITDDSYTKTQDNLKSKDANIKNRLTSYLTELAAGIWAQKKDNYLWTNVINEAVGTEHNSYSTTSKVIQENTKNYLEASASAIYIATYLKAMRLGLLSSDTYKSGIETAYQNYISNFITDDNTIINTCASAGLGGGSVNIDSEQNDYKSGGQRYRNGTADYYTRGYDVTKITSYQEGKPLGAFILASTEYERFMKADYAPSFAAENAEIPTAQTVTKGQSVTLHAATMAKPLAKYQWYSYPASDAQASKAKRAETTVTTISGATSSDLTVTPEANTYYYCVATNSAGSAQTEPVLLTVSEVGNEGTNTPSETKVTEVVTFPKKTLRYEMTPADATKIEVTASGTANNSDYLLSGYTGYVKMDSKGSLSLNIPDGATNINVTLLSSSSVSSLNLNGTKTSTTWSGNKTDGYTYSFNINNSLAGSTYTIKKVDGISYINKITITYSLGSSTEPTPSTDTSATFTYNGSALSFTDYAATINLGSSQANSNITVNATPATGASIKVESGNTSIAGNVITITTPAAGSSARYEYTVTAADGKTTQTYTINVSVSSASTGETNVYSYKVENSGITAPGINTSKYITDNSNNKLVKMTFGGWKWNGGKYIKPNTTTEITDSWKNSTGGNNIASIDNYQYWFEGTQDAVDESKALTGTIYGKPRYGWFVSPTRVDGKTTESHPFTLPVRGSFMTFEPTMNGTLSIYILQNGAWNTDKSGKYTDTDGEGTITYSNGEIAAGEFRPHAFHVVNQRGLTVQEFSPNYSVETKQTVNTKYYCMFEGDYGFNQTKYDDPHNVARWTEFKDYMSEGEKQRCHDNWKNGVGGAQTITELDNGSFLAIEKGIVKYTFHVTGNETYYFFSNFSKMGFSGARFTPDEAQPQPQDKVAEGQISTLELSDVIAYDKITPTENGTIAGTNLKNYTYKIGDKEIAPVAGVSIPQFYSITLDRTFKAGQWTTLTLPFNLTQDEVQKIFGAGTQIIMLDKATLSNGGAHLHFFYHEIQNVLPGYPYLIKPTLEDITNDANVSVTKADNNTALTSFTVYGKCINPFISQFEVNTTPYTFKGTPGYCTAEKSNNNNVSGYSVKYEANDIFVSEGDGKLYVSGGASYGKGYRAWLQKNKAITTPVKSISVVMSSFSDDDDTTTSIDVAEMAPDLIEALGIQTGVYNLSGQRVANDTRNLKAGIYIVNGKKTVVR